MQPSAISAAAARAAPLNFSRRVTAACTASAHTTPTASVNTSSHDASRRSGICMISLARPAAVPMSPAYTYRRTPSNSHSWRRRDRMNNVPIKNSGMCPAFSMVRPA